jgi:glycosyltransferase involved in cell wall biosynthesis
LRAFADLSVPARLVIVGPDDRDGCVQELERLQSDLGLQDQVMLTGPRFGIQKLEAFVDADLFVLPSQNENFGNVAMEAAACGVPVIVTDRCGVAPYIQDRSGLVVPYSVGPLTRALHQLLTDRALSERFRANAVHIRRELSWEQPVAVQEQIYQAVLAQADKQA